MIPAGLVSVGAYVPAQPLTAPEASRLAAFLDAHTLLPKEYVDTIRTQRVLPGSVETNYDGWESKPWFDAWKKTLPPSKQKDPFLGTRERRRVPLDPRSLRESIHPHPMLATHAECVAGAIALLRADVDPDSIDLVLAYSQIPDQLPSSASALQHVLQLPNAGAYGVDTCCSTFVTMLELATTLVQAGVRERVLVACSHIASHVHDPSEYCCVRLGDAAVAAVVSAVDLGFGVVASHSTSNGSVHDAVLMVQRRPSLLRRTALGPTHEQEFVTFANQDACKVIAQNSNVEMLRMVAGLYERAGVSARDIGFFVTHQPVEWAGNAWREALGLPVESFYESYVRYGNIGCASVGVNLCEALELEKIAPARLMLIASSGAGENHVGLLERASPRLVQCCRVGATTERPPAISPAAPLPAVFAPERTDA